MAHKPEYIREAFAEAIADRRLEDAVAWGRALYHCTDTMPSDLCQELDVPVGSSYAQAAQKLLKTAMARAIRRMTEKEVA